MSRRIAIRLEDAELAALNAEVAAGRAANRSKALRRSITRRQREQRYRAEESLVLDLVRRGEALYSRPALRTRGRHLPRAGPNAHQLCAPSPSSTSTSDHQPWS